MIKEGSRCEHLYRHTKKKRKRKTLTGGEEVISSREVSTPIMGLISCPCIFLTLQGQRMLERPVIAFSYRFQVNLRETWISLRPDCFPHCQLLLAEFKPPVTEL